jgi:AcrR family transcriptional regulator
MPAAGVTRPQVVAPAAEPGDGGAVAFVRPGLRERKKRETRAALASAALRLAVELGPDGVTIDAISEAADVSPRTFFNYFATKDDAILGTDPSRATDVRALLADRPADEAPLAALLATFTAWSAPLIDHADEWSQRIRLLHEHPTLVPRYLASLAEVERELVAEMAGRCGLDPEADLYPALVVGVAVTAMRLAIHRWNGDARRQRLADVLDAAFADLARGLPDPAAAPRPRRART